MRRTVRRRIVVFAGCAAAVAMIVVVATVGVFQIALPIAKLGQANRQSLERIRCDDAGQAPGADKQCDISEFKNDWELDGADFLLIKGPRYFVLSNPQYRALWLNFSDPDFVRRFRGFETWETPTREVWRLYSERRDIGNRGVEIMIGQRERADWDLVNRPLPPGVDVALKQEADRIAARLIVEGGHVESRRVNSRADGWQIVEADTGRVVRWNGEIPAMFPKGRRLAAERTGLYREGGDVYVVRADENDDMLAVSVAHVGDLWLLVPAVGAVGTLAFLLAYVVGVEWLRRYFALRGGRPTSVSEALRAGEGRTVEFKHGLTEDAVLRAVTAFANTNDGTIFVGIDDAGRVRGVELPTMKARDEFRHRVFTLVRDKIQPCPAVELDFENVDGFVVARVFVRRGEAPLYYFRGVSYVRDGESSVTPRPEQVTRILAEYAF